MDPVNLEEFQNIFPNGDYSDYISHINLAKNLTGEDYFLEDAFDGKDVIEIGYGYGVNSVLMNKGTLASYAAVGIENINQNFLENLKIEDENSKVLIKSAELYKDIVEDKILDHMKANVLVVEGTPDIKVTVYAIEHILNNVINSDKGVVVFTNPYRDIETIHKFTERNPEYAEVHKFNNQHIGFIALRKKIPTPESEQQQLENVP